MCLSVVDFLPLPTATCGHVVAVAAADLKAAEQRSRYKQVIAATCYEVGLL